MQGFARLFLMASTILSGAFVAPALAQTPAAPAAEGSRQAVVVVTAQKRAEDVQDVPVSVAVVGEAQLEAFSLNEATDLQYLVPSVQLTNTAGPRNFGFFVRGVGTSSFSSETLEPSVAIVVDGVVLGQGGAALADLPDIQRIEVLRGPQGTLFGKNASAGVVNIVTRNPEDEFGVEVGATFSDPLNEQKYRALVTGPLVPGFANFLVSARRNIRDGLVENVVDGRRLNNRDDWGARAKLELTPSDDLDILFSADYWRRNADCCVWTLRSFGPVATSVAQSSHRAAGIVPGPQNLRQNIGGPVFSKVTNGGLSAEANLALGDHTLTAISAWRSWSTTDGLDSDSSPVNALDTNFADFDQEQISHELRLTSPQGGALEYVVGLYYYNSEVTNVSFQRFPLNPPAAFLNRRVTTDAESRNVAAFGQATVRVSDAFRLIAGGRVLNEETSAVKRRVDLISAASQTSSGSTKDDAFVWRLGAQVDLAPTVMAFATASRGYKGGGLDANIGLPTLDPVAPEIPTSYEIGIRTTSFDNRLTANATFFTAEVEDYQTSALDPNRPGTFIIANAGRVETSGVEFDFAWTPVDWASFTLNGANVDATFEDFPRAQCYNGQTAAQGCVGGVQDLSGKPTPFSPEWTWNLGARLERDFNELGITGFFDVLYSARTDAFIRFPIDPNARQDGFGLLNASVGFLTDDQRYRVSLFAKNLTDEHYVAAIFATPFDTAPNNYSQFPVYEAQRIVGVSLDAAF